MAKKDSSDGMGFSRRNFLKSTSVVGLAETVIAPEQTEAQSMPAAVGPGDVPVRLNVNGRQIDLMIEPRVTLLDALRTRANLTGNKRGCDRGACGACTMIVDGRTVYSCSTLAIEVQGKQIRNVDGLASGDRLHPVQQAFCDKDALMCGFCTPGFIMASVGLLEKHPNPTPEQIKKGLDGNICRCGTFSRIFEAVSSVKGGTAWLNPISPAGWRAAAPPLRSEFNWPANPTVLGTRVKRLDGPDKVTGRAKYTFDIARPRMLYARIVRSPHPHARVVSVDLSAAPTHAGRQDRAGLARPGNSTEQSRDVPGRRGGGRSRRYRGTRHRRRAGDQGRVRGPAARNVVEKALAGTAPEVFTGGNVRAAPAAADRRSGGRLQGGGARDRGDLRDAGHHAHLHGDRTARYASGMATS